MGTVALLHRLCKRAGAKRVSNSVSEAIEPYLFDVCEKLVKIGVNHAKTKGRVTLKKQDIEYALTIMKQLPEYANNLTTLKKEITNLEEHISELKHKTKKYESTVHWLLKAKEFLFVDAYTNAKIKKGSLFKNYRDGWADKGGWSGF